MTDNEVTIADLVAKAQADVDRQIGKINITPELRNSTAVREIASELCKTITYLSECLSDANQAGVLQKERISQLEKEVDSIKTQLLSKNSERDGMSSVSPPIEEYYTDEEMLAEETGEWENAIQKGYKRKKTELAHQTKNSVATSKPKKEPKPPPIHIERVTSLPALKKMVEEQTTDVMFTTLSNDVVKINTVDSDGFRAITKCFRDQKIPHYTYQNKQERPIQVMIKGIHKSWTTNEVLTDLRDQFGSTSVLQVVRKLEWKTKNPLDMCVVDFQKGLDIDKIYQIKQVLKGRVTVHPIKSSKHISQCKRCQEFHHTRNYCAKPPRCVKCAKGHLTEECTKSREAPAKCANCGGEHTANYRGCPVATEAMKRRSNVPLYGHTITSAQVKSTQPKFIPKKPIICNQKPTQKMTQQDPNLQSYANVLRNQKLATQGPSRRQSIDPTSEMQCKIDQIFEVVMNLSKSVSTLNERVGKLESSRPKKPT